jgi:hypothetical protein
VSKLRIGPDLTLPVDAVTQAIGILAKRRVGKSYTARRFAEQFLKSGQQVVIVDPKGDWWGIRSSADGKNPGLPVVILGGERGDVPLEVGGGEVVAKLVVEERVSVVLDLSLFRKHEVATFMTAFLENLYRLKAKEEYRTPLMMIIDEADAIMSQKPQPNEARMLGAGEDIVRRGGQRGIGCMLITQRSAVLNKNVLTQCEMIVALRTIAPQDLKALDAWIEVHGEQDQRETLMASLPSLPVGDAWFWSPGWPTTDGIFKRVHVSPIETFDSGASPKAGEKRVEPKNLADVDLGALTKKMSATIERAKADDPKELRKQIAERDKAIRQLQKGGVSEKIVEKPVRDEAAIERAVAAAIAGERKKFRPVLAKLQRIATITTDLPAAVGDLAQLLDVPVSIAAPPRSAANPHTMTAPVARRPAPPQPQTSAQPASTEGITPSKQRVLNALAALEQLGIAPAQRIQVAIFAGYTENGHFNNMLGELRTAGLLDYPAGGTAQLTDAGRAIADPGRAISSLTELHERWLAKLSPSEAKLARVLIDAHPEPMSRADLAERTGYTENGHFNNMCGKLRTMGLAVYPAGAQIVAANSLFPEGLA